MNAYLKPHPQCQLVLDFEDNRLLPALFGMHDQNLARMEQALEVTIISRGNRVLIQGETSDCRAARSSLNDLYRRLEAGEVIDIGDVDGAVRMAEAEAQRIAPKPRKAKKAEARHDPAGLPHKAGSKQKSAGKQKKSKTEARHRPVPTLNPIEQGDNGVAIRTRTRSIVPRTPRQADYMTGMATHELVFGIGPAGTGKTYLAVAMAVAKMMAGEIDRIILSRPAVEAGENLGFLPGDLKDKVDPYLRPLYDALYEMMPKDHADRRIESGQIEVAPLAYMRGRTLKNAFIILDEAQNTTAVQMKMFLTRFGDNARMVVCGDPSQVDLPAKQGSGLSHALGVLTGTPGISIIHFGEDDVVRHPLVGRIVKAYDKAAG